jgi:hypothetical protein
MRALKPRPRRQAWGARPGLPFGSGHDIDPPTPQWENLAGKRLDWDRIAELKLEAAEVHRAEAAD